jgi:ParB family chromosome partitioning protein
MIATKTKAPKGREAKISQIPIDAIRPHAENARVEFDEVELRSLADSLEHSGVLQPAVVRPVENSANRFELIVGERRFRAAKLAGWTELPCIVRDVDDAEALELQLVENVQRVNLNAMEIARGLERICRRKGDPTKGRGDGKTQAEASRLIGRPQPWINAHLRLLTLPKIWQNRVEAGELTMDRAKVLTRIPTTPRILADLERDMAENPWAYRTAEDFERNLEKIARDAGVARKPHGNRRPASQRSPGGAPARLDETGIPTPPPAARDRDPQPTSARKLAEILAAIAELQSVEDLELVMQAAIARREAMAEESKAPAAAERSPAVA